jgi:acetyl-CoA carboxylase carboxyltransferase component
MKTGLIMISTNYVDAVLAVGARGFIDDVILPHEMRKRICSSLVVLKDKKNESPLLKHESIPL